MYDRPFRWWVQSVMPLVFDDSLSYYEVLAKLTKYIEGLTGDIEQIEKILGTIEGIEDVTQFTEFLETIQAEIGNLENLQTDTKANLVSAINEVALKADIAYWKPPTGIPESDLSQEVKDKLNRTISQTEYIINNAKLKPAPANNSPSDLGLGTYTVPDGGIPWDTLSDDVKNRINQGSSGGTTDYTALNNKPQINGHTLNAGNNTADSLGLGTYTKPIMGIPESDLSAEVQEKLNTSGGIADSQQTFVASRDYEAGELVYINGVLYRTKYKILAGTNMIPGNNIEVTDISSELEKINSDIDALQSGAGPDSWNLTTTVQSYSYLEKVDFFEYFNCIGGENYNFIVEPVDPSNAAAYYLDICKRDGTIVLSQHVTETVDYTNRKRFTFVPVDSGEYYCKFYRTASGYPATTSAVKVTIEYTQSQGISELWTQVNAAAELEPRVSAVETLVSQQQAELEDLEDIPQRVESLENDTDKLDNAFSDGEGKNNIKNNYIDLNRIEGVYVNSATGLPMFNGAIKKISNVISFNDVSFGGDNWCMFLTGNTLSRSNWQGTYNSVYESCYVDAVPNFVIGHIYRARCILVEGTYNLSDPTLRNFSYLKVATRSEQSSRNLYNNSVWKCTFIPQIIGALIRVGTYNCKIAYYLEDITDTYNEAVPEAKNMLQIFDKITAVGDSLTAGYTQSTSPSINSEAAKARGTNWPTYIGADIGRTITNIAVGGSSWKDWRYNTGNVDISNAHIDTNCYIIGLGINDSIDGNTVGTYADISEDKVNNADSVYGNADFVIRTLHEYNPNAHIFVLTIPVATVTDYKAINEALRYIANQYEYVHCIDLAELYLNEYSYGIFEGLRYGIHYEPLGYRVMANYISTAINTFIFTNYQLFVKVPYEL